MICIISSFFPLFFTIDSFSCDLSLKNNKYTYISGVQSFFRYFKKIWVSRKFTIHEKFKISRKSQTLVLTTNDNIQPISCSAGKSDQYKRSTRVTRLNTKRVTNLKNSLL